MPDLAQKLTQEISEKFPEMWDRLRKKYQDKPFNFEEDYGDNFYLVLDDRVIELGFAGGVDGYDYRCQKLSFIFLYALLEEFFKEEYGLIISVVKCGYGNEYVVYIDTKKHEELYKENQYKKTKNEAKYAAVIKACEIAGGKRC